MAAGMNAQLMEATLVREVKEAKQAWQAEKDPVNKEGLWLMWEEAKKELNSFRMQQVAGGEGCKQGCKTCLQGGVRQKVVETLSRAMPPGQGEGPRWSDVQLEGWLHHIVEAICRGQCICMFEGAANG